MKMQNNKRPRRLVHIIIGCCIALWLSGNVLAQTADQVRQFQDLTPEARAAILQVLEQTADQEDAPISEPTVVSPRPLASPADDSTSDLSAEANSTPILSISGLTLSRDNDLVESDLMAFGYDLFAGEPSTFAPVTDIPVPVDYIIGPGDAIEIQLFGNENAQYNLVVTRDGLLNFPGIGPISVVGLEFSGLQKTLQQRVSEQLIGVKISITMGPLRSIRVFVLGDAYRPGSYTVSALSTLTNALFLSGGVNTIGSLRNVQLKRNGRLVSTLDLYDLLLQGDTSGDARLQPGDVIFIPPVGRTVGVEGEVRRPAIYELRDERTVGQVLALAGGLLPTAHPSVSQIDRINDRRERIVIDIDLASDAGLATQVSSDDNIRVYSILEKREDIILLSGHVFRPGVFEWRPGMRISDLISSVDVMRPKADLHYVLIRRELRHLSRVRAFSADIGAALSMKHSAADVVLEPRDEITVFAIGSDREGVIGTLLAELRIQSSMTAPRQEVIVSGRVRAPGRYPLEDGMRVSDLIRAGGYLDEAAYPIEAELTRFTIGIDQARKSELLTIDLVGMLSGESSADLLLLPHDVLNIKEIPNWHALEQAEIVGEVRFPGTYPISRGETLRSLVSRAGGMTGRASPDGAVFLREFLRLKEEKQLAAFATRLKGDIESANAIDVDPQTLAARQGLLEQIRETKATGRLVIDLPTILASTGGVNADVVLQDGDQLLVPVSSQTVTVIGEVQFPTSHIYEDNVSRNDYIERSGGMTANADKRRIYIVRANGAVELTGGSAFFRSNNSRIRAGDTVVVPLDADRMSKLTLWTNISTIIYNIAISAAAVASF